MSCEPYRLFRIDREDVLLPLLRDLVALSRVRAVAGRDHGYNSAPFITACDVMRDRLYNEQDTIIEALRELKDATEAEANR